MAFLSNIYIFCVWLYTAIRIVSTGLVARIFCNWCPNATENSSVGHELRQITPWSTLIGPFQKLSGGGVDGS